MTVQPKQHNGPAHRDGTNTISEVDREKLTPHAARQRALRIPPGLRSATAPEKPPEPQRSPENSSATPQPTYSFEEILAEHKERRFTKIELASHLAYPPSKPYVQDLDLLVNELTTRMLKSVPDELSDINPSDIVVRLVDRSSFNAYVLPSDHGPFQVFINRGLIEESLAAPEFADKALCIDALAGVVAHEVCHANFQRRYQARANSIIQEEYCDILPAKMLERVGLRPEAMSRLCDLLSRINKELGARKIRGDEPHASAPIRKEIFEKGAWESYERERRKGTIGGDNPSIEDQRTLWTNRLEQISLLAKQDHIISPIREEIVRRGFEAASRGEKLSILHQFISEHMALIQDCSHVAITDQIASFAIEALADVQESRAHYSQHPVFIKLSELLYEARASQKATGTYHEICKALGTANFGAFEKADEAYLSLIQARTKGEILVALDLCQPLTRFACQPAVHREDWRHTLLPQTLEQLRTIFTETDFQALKSGETIPFPFALHETVRQELAAASNFGYSGNAESQSFALLRRFLDHSGINLTILDLLQTQRHVLGYTYSPTAQLFHGTESGTHEAFKISVEAGISMLFPPRSKVTKEGTFELGSERESAFAEFIAHRGELLLQAASQLTSETFFDFVEKNALLILPQLHPVGILSDELTRRSQNVARVVMEKFDTLIASPSSTTFREAAVSFLRNFTPLRSSPLFDIYTDYHESVASAVPGERVDRGHPLVRAVLEDPHKLLTNSEKISALSTLHAFHGGENRLVGEQLRKAFISAVGDEKTLKELLGVHPHLPPALFIKEITQINDRGAALWVENFRVRSYSDEPVRELRSHYIHEYLTQLSPKALTIDQLHILYDLCSGPSSRAIAQHIADMALSHAEQSDLSYHSDTAFLLMYKRLSAMGVLDSSVPLQQALQNEVIRRAKALNTPWARSDFFVELAYPHPFSVGERNAYLGIFGPFDGNRFKNIREISSIYTPKTVDPAYERFLVGELVNVYSEEIRGQSGLQFDDGSALFQSLCQDVLKTFQNKGLPPGLRARVLRGIADELLLQRNTAYLFRDNLATEGRGRSALSFANLMMISHQNGEVTNGGAVQVHNALIELRRPHKRDLREALFQFLLSQRPDDTMPVVRDMLIERLRVEDTSKDAVPSIFTDLGISGVRLFSSSTEEDRQRAIIEYHLRALHQRFSELDVRAKGASLSMLAIDSSPDEESFATFRDTQLIPRILPKDGPYNDLLLNGIKDYFEFYSNSVHHKYMVACAILASAQGELHNVSELTRVGLVAKSFLGSHGTAGYKFLQRIRNHPSTPQEIKDVLCHVLDETISLPRWTVHERIAEFGPADASQHWIGRAKAGSMCLSVPVRRADGSESFMSILHPGAQMDSLYWLQNFTTMAANLAQINPKLGVLAPMAQQTRRLVENETDFAHSPRKQQEIAEVAYTFAMEFPAHGIAVESSCAPLVSSEAKPHRTDFMKDSGYKDAARASGRPFLDLIAEFREKSASGEWSRQQINHHHTILKTIALSILANEVRLVASGEGKDHDRHPGNYLVDLDHDHQKGRTMIRLNHFDFGCTDMAAPSPETLRETAVALQRTIEATSAFSMLFNQKSITNSVAQSLFERGAAAPGTASIPLGLIAALGANERIPLNGKERSLLEPRDLALACKVGLQAAIIPEELRIRLPKGLRGWILSKVYERIDTKGICFSKTL